MKRYLAGLFSLIAAMQAMAYKEPVHRRITENVYERLAIDFQARLGVDKNATVVLSEPLVEWLARGAYDEDDWLLTGSVIQRPVNHFFDPVYGVPLSAPVFGLVCAPIVLPSQLGLLPPVAIRADQWSGAFGPAALNFYDLHDVRQHYRTALLDPNMTVRDHALRDLFYGLGHVVHLIQDMAQPEHTRNDQHLPGSHVWLTNGTAASLYEEWGMINLAGLATQPCNPPPCPPLVDFEGYATVKLPTYASYFHTPGVDSAGRSLGKGMADFANRNFVTQDTNYSDYDEPGERPCFPYPAPVLPSLSTIRVDDEQVLDEDGDCCVTLPDVVQTVFTSPVRDTFTGVGDTDPFHTFVSSLDHETREFDHGVRVFSLADESYHSRAAMLIPRAVAYSAGIVEHFFRGKIDAEWKRTPSGAYDLKITNHSAETIGADAKLWAFYRATPAYFGWTTGDDMAPIVSGVKIAQLVPGFAGLASNQSVTIPELQPFLLNTNDDVSQFERRIAIVGTLGTESSAVIGLVQPVGSSSGPLRVIGRTTTVANGLMLTNVSVFSLPFPAQYRITSSCPTVSTIPSHTPLPNSSVTFNANCTGYEFKWEPVAVGQAIRFQTTGCIGCRLEFDIMKGAKLLRRFHPDNFTAYDIVCTTADQCSVTHVTGPAN